MSRTADLRLRQPDLRRPLSPDLPIAPGWWEDLQVRYATPERTYHTLAHVEAVLENWRAVDAAGLWQRRAETWVAVLLHDVIYELGVGGGANERASAALVPSWVEQFDVDADVDAVQALILATASHGQHEAHGDLALFLDCDMAILGAPAEVYDRYAEGVRAEYEPHLPTGAYGPGRAAFLASLVGKRLFWSGFFAHLEAPAHANLERERQTLC